MPPSSPSHYYILREELNQKVNSFENSEFMYLGTLYQCNSTVLLDTIFQQITTNHRPFFTLQRLLQWVTNEGLEPTQCHHRCSCYQTKNDRRNSGGTLRQKETKNALKT